jgi:NADH dehydrogenase
MSETHIVIVGGGFAGLNAAKQLAKDKQTRITLIDRRNHHLFQPLLYQVAMAGLSPADIAAPIRAILSKYENVRVLCSHVRRVDSEKSSLETDDGDVSYDYLILACGAMHSYFGNDQWEQHAPGLKTIEQATEIRRRVLSAFERAEVTDAAEERRQQLTFVIVGGGPTGVELAGAIGEMSRFTLSKDFRNIDAKLSRVILIEAGPRILPMFSEELSSRATRDLESLGVQVWAGSMVTGIDDTGVDVSGERIQAATVLWAAGVKASSLGEQSGFKCDRAGRIQVSKDLSIPNNNHIFVAGDQCAFIDVKTNRQLPGVAPAAVQQGQFIAKTIRDEILGKPRGEFRYHDKGQMATIGRSRAITEVGKYRFTGMFAWLVWLVVHIYFLTGFRNRLFVVLSWAWSFVTFRRGARLIVNKKWQSYASQDGSTEETLLTK